jgi:hypothetical protein
MPCLRATRPACSPRSCISGGSHPLPLSGPSVHPRLFSVGNRSPSFRHGVCALPTAQQLPVRRRMLRRWRRGPTRGRGRPPGQAGRPIGRRKLLNHVVAGGLVRYRLKRGFPPLRPSLPFLSPQLGLSVPGSSQPRCCDTPPVLLGLPVLLLPFPSQVRLVAHVHQPTLRVEPGSPSVLALWPRAEGCRRRPEPGRGHSRRRCRSAAVRAGTDGGGHGPAPCRLDRTG